MTTTVIDNIPVHIEGTGPETIVMIHGWPDTHRLWDSQVAALSADYRCVRFTLPGFEPGAARKTHTLDELCTLFLHIVDTVCPDAPVTLLLHGWGCFFGYQFYLRFPQRVKRIVGVDVGDIKSLRQEATPRVLFMIAAYQNWLALAWRLGGSVGDWMARRMVRWARCPTIEDHRGAQQAYPYYMTWWERKDSYRRQARPFEPECPMLYIYGTRKPFMFHAQAWLERLRARPGNRVVPFETGHWVMTKRPEAFNALVKEWLASSA